LVETIPLTSSSIPRELVEQLKNAEDTYKALEKEESKIKRNVDNSIQMERQLTQALNNPLIMNPFIFPMGNNQVNDPYYMQFPQANSPQQQRQMDPVMQAKLEEDRILRQIQQEEYKEVERKIKEQKQKEQDDIVKRRKEEEDKIQKAKQLELEKQLKKQSLPQEPTEGDPTAILIIFRLPDGTRIQRRFNRQTGVQVLYDYLDVQDLKFESSANYDLIQPNPFTCLSDKGKTINDYFEGSDHEVLTIREQVV